MSIKKFENFRPAIDLIEKSFKEEGLKKSIKVLQELFQESETDELIKDNKLALFAVQDLIFNKIRKLEEELKNSK
jgi:Neuraminidase (sialidase)